MPIILDPPVSPTPSGYYTDANRIRSKLGTYNTDVLSNLEDLTLVADNGRIADDIAIAESWLNRQIRVAGYVSPFATASRDFPVLQDAATCYAAFLVAQHRNWFGVREGENLFGGLLQMAKDYVESFATGMDGELLPDGTGEQGGIESGILERWPVIDVGNCYGW